MIKDRASELCSVAQIRAAKGGNDNQLSGKTILGIKHGSVKIFSIVISVFFPILVEFLAEYGHLSWNLILNVRFQKDKDGLIIV